MIKAINLMRSAGFVFRAKPSSWMRVRNLVMIHDARAVIVIGGGALALALETDDRVGRACFGASDDDRLCRFRLELDPA
jgi:hypothetical protein